MKLKSILVGVLCTSIMLSGCSLPNLPFINGSDDSVAETSEEFVDDVFGEEEIPEEEISEDDEIVDDTQAVKYAYDGDLGSVETFSYEGLPTETSISDFLAKNFGYTGAVLKQSRIKRADNVRIYNFALNKNTFIVVHANQVSGGSVTYFMDMSLESIAKTFQYYAKYSPTFSLNAELADYYLDHVVELSGIGKQGLYLLNKYCKDNGYLLEDATYTKEDASGNLDTNMRYTKVEFSDGNAITVISRIDSFVYISEGVSDES